MTGIYKQFVQSKSLKISMIASFRSFRWYLDVSQVMLETKDMKRCIRYCHAEVKFLLIIDRKCFQIDTIPLLKYLCKYL